MAKKKVAGPISKKKQAERRPNLFESIYNKKKFDVLGKKSKDSAKRRGQARKEGIEKRKGTLLVEYKQRQSANRFQDRRFGENDEGLSAEDKALARFQKQKFKEIAGRRQDLENEEAEQDELTHLGAPLRDRNDQDDFGFEDEEDYEMDPATEAALHFGGGFQLKQDAANEHAEPEAQPKSKKQVMEEIMAKSKAFRAEKAKQKEEDEEEAEKLDQELDELMKTGGLAAFMRPKGVKSVKVAEDGPDAAYDVARREMVFDNRAKVSERTKTAEELAQEEVQQLEALERERLKRVVGEDVEPVVQEPEGGYAKRRAKRKRQEAEPIPPETTGDALEDDFELDKADEEGSSEESSQSSDLGSKPSLDARRQKRAAGHHPLQDSFREAAGSLMKKYGLLESDSEEEEQEQEGGVEDGTASQDDGSTSDTGDSSESEPDSPLLSTLEHSTGGIAIDSSGKHSDSEEEQVEASDDEDGSQSRGANAVPQERVADGDSLGTTLHTSEAQQDHVVELPFKIQAPGSYAEFASLVADRPADELSTAIQRIRMSTNIALLEENKTKMQVFYGILVQHFAILAGQVPLPSKHLDLLTVQILELTSLVPLYAATTAIARLQRLQGRLQASLASGGGSCWPGQAQLLLLKLWATVFPASDKRHSVLTPALLLIGSHLALCPIQSLQNAKSGLFLASLALEMASAASRWMPEPLLFANRVLALVLSASTDSSANHVFSFIKTVEARGHESEDVVKLRLDGIPEEEAEQLPESCAVAAVELVGCFARQNKAVPALPEAMSSALGHLQTLASQDFSKAVSACARKIHAEVASQMQEAIQERKPLQKVKLKKEIKQFNPRFEEDFTAGKDYDPDRERAETRKLKRQLKNERRGAMRELRKDASYLGEQRDLERQTDEKERKRVLRGNNAWLSKLEQDFKSGGQGGMWKKNKNR